MELLTGDSIYFSFISKWLSYLSVDLHALLF